MTESLMIMPVTSLAAEGTSPTALNAVQFIVALLAFVGAILILGKLAWPKILGALDEREQKILGEISAAEEARERADKALKEYETSLAEARAEANALIEQTKADQSRLAAELNAKAQAQAGELMGEARRNIEAMKKAAVAEIYQEAAKAATYMAEKILEREVNAGDQERLVDDAVSTFAS